MLKSRSVWGSVVVVLLCATLSLSQATLGVIAGTVTDASGAVVTGADISSNVRKVARNAQPPPVRMVSTAWKH